MLKHYPFDRSLVEMMLTAALNRPVSIESFETAGGGCINDCYALKTAGGKFFLKRNSASQFPGMFESESAGLELMNRSVAGLAPLVISKAEHGDEQLLLLEHIEPASPQKNFWEDFAAKLVMLHKNSGNFFGLDHDNYIGSLPQSNRQYESWNAFFIMERLEPQLKKAIDGKQLPTSIHRPFEKLFLRLDEIFPSEKSSLLHGDLWSGNYLIGADGLVKLIDPAVYFGFREMDLAMAKLFGGFDSSLFRFYNQLFPLENGFEKRTDICNLYPLLVHVNLFGGHYAHEVSAIIEPFR